MNSLSFILLMNLCHVLISLRPYAKITIRTRTTLNGSRRLPPIETPLDIISSDKSRITNCIDFIDKSPEPYHVVSTVSKILKQNQFQKIDESTSWRDNKTLKAGGKYYFTRDGSTIVAFTIGSKFQAGHGFKLIGAHTDSPNLKLKPITKRSANKLVQLNIECYGGGLWHTWFDRDLSLAGRIILRKQDNDHEFFETKLIKINRPILRIPNLCIHLRTPDERESFKVNKEDHLVPILCDEIQKVLGATSTTAITPTANTTTTASTTTTTTTTTTDNTTISTDSTTITTADPWTESQQPELLSLLAKELNCTIDDIADFELSLYDIQNGSQSGLNQEYICSSRIDNLASCYAAVDALTTYSQHSEAIQNDEDVSIIALFDHEEVGSGSTVGAGSSLMRDTMERIHNAFEAPDRSALDYDELFKTGLARSMIFSVDMAHAVHPNYANKHDKSHTPRMNGGIVIKTNVNQRYATGGITGFFVRELGRRAGVPIQEFSVRNDCPCGSTIGPVISQNTGVRAVDLGMPQLSMHSIREMMGAADLTYAHRLFLTFLKDFRQLDHQLRTSSSSDSDDE